MIGYLIIGALALLFYYFLIKPLRYWKDLGIPQSKPWIIFGDNASLVFRKKSFAEWLEDIYNMYPTKRYSGFYQFYKPTLVIRDPELIKQITIKDFDHFTDHRAFVDPETDPFWAKNLFSLRGQEWREMRATLSGSFTSSKMRHMFGLMTEASENFVQYFLKKDQEILEVEMKNIFTRFTNDVIATTAFGLKVDSLENQKNDFYTMGKETTDMTGFWKTMRIFALMMAPKFCKHLNIRFFSKDVTEFFRGLIKDTIRTREEQGIVRPDMINILMEARKGNIKHEENTNDTVIDTGFAVVQESTENKKMAKAPKNISDDDIVSQALIFFFAGFDAVSNLMCFLAYELAVNVEIQDRLREEIKKTSAECNGNVTYEALLKMKYLDMVVTETLRKWPPGVGADRLCTKPYTIKPNSPDEKPLHIQKDDVLFIPVYGIHRDPEYYPDPLKFDPERFSEENKDNIKPYTYLPFGVGPRNCIGSRFALLETKAVIFYILLNFAIVPTNKSKIPLRLQRKSFNMMAEGGYWFGLKRLSTK